MELLVDIYSVLVDVRLPVWQFNFCLPRVIQLLEEVGQVGFRMATSNSVYRLWSIWPGRQTVWNMTLIPPPLHCYKLTKAVRNWINPRITNITQKDTLLLLQIWPPWPTRGCISQNQWERLCRWFGHGICICTLTNLLPCLVLLKYVSPCPVIPSIN